MKSFPGAKASASPRRTWMSAASPCSPRDDASAAKRFLTIR